MPVPAYLYLVSWIINWLFYIMTAYISHLSPASFLINSIIRGVLFKASATAALISNPSRANLIAGSSKSLHFNRPYFCEAWCMPLTSPGTAIARPPGERKKIFYSKNILMKVKWLTEVYRNRSDCS